MPRVQCPSKFTKVKSIISSFDIYILIAYFESYAYMNSTLGKKQHASILLSVSENDLLSTSTAHLVDYLENDLDDQRAYIDHDARCRSRFLFFANRSNELPLIASRFILVILSTSQDARKRYFGSRDV